MGVLNDFAVEVESGAFGLRLRPHDALEEFNRKRREVAQATSPRLLLVGEGALEQLDVGLRCIEHRLDDFL